MGGVEVMLGHGPATMLIAMPTPMGACTTIRTTSMFIWNDAM